MGDVWGNGWLAPAQRRPSGSGTPADRDRGFRKSRHPSNPASKPRQPIAGNRSLSAAAAFIDDTHSRPLTHSHTHTHTHSHDPRLRSLLSSLNYCLPSPPLVRSSPRLCQRQRHTRISRTDPLPARLRSHPHPSQRAQASSHSILLLLRSPFLARLDAPPVTATLLRLRRRGCPGRPTSRIVPSSCLVHYGQRVSVAARYQTWFCVLLECSLDCMDPGSVPQHHCSIPARRIERSSPSGSPVAYAIGSVRVPRQHPFEQPAHA